MRTHGRIRGLLVLAALGCGIGCGKEGVEGPEQFAMPDSLVNVIGLPGYCAFSTFFGGIDQDQIRDVAIDAAGNVIVVGGTRSTNFPTTPGAFDRTPNGNYDAFVARFSASGQLQFSTLIGGPGYDRAYAVELDPQGYIIIAGRTGGGLPATAGSFDPTFVGGVSVGGYGPQDGFVCKLRPAADGVIFCGYIGTGDEHIARDVAVDPAGNIYAPYLADSTGIPGSWTTGGYMAAYPGSSTNLVLKIAPDGKKILGGTWFGGSGEEYGDPSLRWAQNRVYLLSRTTSTNLPTPGGFDHSLNGAWDIYLAVFSDDLKSLSFATYAGGSATEDIETHNLAVDASGNAFIAASTGSTDLPGTTGHFQAFSGGNRDAFLMRVGPTGALLGTTYYGGRSEDQFQGVAVDGKGRVFMSSIVKASLPTITLAPLGTVKLGTAGLVAMSNNLDTLLFAQFTGGSQSDEARTVATGPGGAVVLAGMTQSTNWYTKSPFQGGFGGGSLDGILMRYTGF
jgi:hypothetical protein